MEQARFRQSAFLVAQSDEHAALSRFGIDDFEGGMTNVTEQFLVDYMPIVQSQDQHHSMK